ncbi:MAG: hypothetical protein H5T84_06585, partial [Thermoleophilia bacterium]|nr:hypothetical protein [Thermoleophilia bacterium]
SPPVLKAEVHPQVAHLLNAGAPSRLELLEKRSNRRIVVEAAVGEVALDHVSLLDGDSRVPCL